MNLVFASNNKHKLDEVRSCLHAAIIVRSLSDVWQGADLLEEENTFRGNALSKAQQVFERTRMICLSDDSGLEVDALDGRPGVLSARFAGPFATDQDNRKRLLEDMRGEVIRSARFKTILCLMSEDYTEFFEGTLEGNIAMEPLGNNGFGYDSLFVPSCDTRTLAEMTSDEKNAISHRGNALKKLSDFLAKRSVR
jgi:XTP/dITP diphosphohydrolase